MTHLYLIPDVFILKHFRDALKINSKEYAENVGDNGLRQKQSK